MIALLSLAALGAGDRWRTTALFEPCDDPLARWRSHEFAGETVYRAASENGECIVEAFADGSASGRILEVDIELAPGTRLDWSWWVDAPLAVSDVHERAGDDFAARLYLVFDGGWSFWRTSSLVYVWAPEGAPSEPWPNPFTDRAQMIAVTRGDASGKWTDVSREPFEDYLAAFGEPPPRLVGVAIMSDTDQTGARALGRWRDPVLRTPVRTDQNRR